VPTGREFVDRCAAAFGTAPLTAAEIEDLLALAGAAAHASERIAAPLTCYLAARAELSPAEARRLVEALAADGAPTG